MNLYPYYDVVRDVNGNAVAGATVNIRLTRDGSLAAVYDKAGNPVTQPLVTDPSGTIVNGAAGDDGIGLWAPAGRYRVEVSSGAEIAALPEIHLGPQISNLGESTDLDTLLQPGVYDVFFPVNSPDGASSTTWWYVEVVRHSQSTDNVLQVATRMDGSTDERHFRLRKTALWGPWTRLIDSADPDAAARISISDTGGNFTAGNVEDALAEEADARQAFEATKGLADGLAPLDANAKIPTAHLPALSIADVNVVASETEQLALVAQEGDVAVRSDLNKSFVHNGGTAGTMADWQELLTPTDAVLSVFGRTGVVTAQSGDYTAAQITVTDTGGHFTATDVEGALSEIPGMIDAAKTAYFTESRHTTAPNDTVPVHSWEVSGTETDIDAALMPKGAGAISAQVPDGTAAGGTKRGLFAVDFQRTRIYTDAVASGVSSALVGGFNNKASGIYSCVLGGSNNHATGDRSSILGSDSNEAIGAFSVCVGLNQTVNGQNGVAIGSGNTVDGINAIAIGTDAAKATAERSIAMGSGSDTRTTRGKLAFASARFDFLYGNAQTGLSLLLKTTTDANAAILNSEGEYATPDTTNVPVLPDNHTYAITASIVARDITTGESKIWKIEGGAYRGVGAATVALVGLPTKTVIGEHAATLAWDCNLIVDTTRGSAEIEVTGETGKTIHWVCKFDTVEVG